MVRVMVMVIKVGSVDGNVTSLPPQFEQKLTKNDSKCPHKHTVCLQITCSRRVFLK